MKLFFQGLFASSLLLTSLMFNGCSTAPTLADIPPAGMTQKNLPAATHTNTTAITQTSAPLAATDDLANAQVARLHVGESVSVVFSGTPDPTDLPTHEETIKEDGTITLPLIGPVKAVGLTAGELQKNIHDLYVPKYYVRLNVVVKPGDVVYYVRGEVKNPGRQLYIGETTVTKAITSAQDFTDFASHKVWLIRANGQRIKVNVDKALEDPSLDPQIYPGDQVVVPRRIFL
jgi:polysaccharide biosynthesis/export protein VpsN